MGKRMVCCNPWGQNKFGKMGAIGWVGQKGLLGLHEERMRGTDLFASSPSLPSAMWAIGSKGRGLPEGEPGGFLLSRSIRNFKQSVGVGLGHGG